MPHAVAERAVDLWARGANGGVSQMRTGRHPAVPGTAEETTGIYPPRRGELPRRRAERAAGRFGRALLSHHVLRRRGVLEPARHAHVRDAPTSPGRARSEIEGSRLGA